MLALAVAALFILTTACGNDDDASSDTTAAAAGAGSTAPAATTAAAVTTAAAAPTTGGDTATSAGDDASGASTVATAETDLGPVLVDGDGMTLYLFVPDAQGAPTCVEECAGNWPAVVGPATAGEGVDDSLLGTATRPDDDSEQATYNGWPLYTFGGDQAPGDVNGQGVGDVWFAMDAEGNAVYSSG